MDKRQDIEFLWNVWYNFTLLTPDLDRLKVILDKVITTYCNRAETLSAGVCQFGDSSTKKGVLKIWRAWLRGVSDKRWDVATMTRSRMSHTENARMLCMQQMSEISNCSIQIYKDSCGYDASKRIAYGREMLSAISTGNIRFAKSAVYKAGSEHVNPTMVRPESSEWNVTYGSDPSHAYLPLDRQANFIICTSLHLFVPKGLKPK